MKRQEVLHREELELFSKSELIEKVIRLEEKNKELKALANRGKLENRNNVHRSRRPFDFSRYNKRHVLLKFYYLGWDHNGFVVQESIGETIEQHLFAALIKSCCIESRETSNYHRCGRTDKGVSSFSQVISLDVRSKLDPRDQRKLEDELPYCKMLNRLLPPSIRCVAWCPVPDDFSSRFNCKSRTYKYFFPRGNLNIDAMDKAVRHAIGEHDFRNVCKMDVANGVVSYTRKIIDAKVCIYRQHFRNVPGNNRISQINDYIFNSLVRQLVIRSRNSIGNAGIEKCRLTTTTSLFVGYDVCQMIITGQAFLWHQIRCLMGVLFLVGEEKEKPEVVSELLDIEKCPRKPQYNLAHEIPLNLWRCEYEVDDWYTDEAELRNTIKLLQKDWTLYTTKSVMIENMLSDMEDSIDLKDTSFQTDCLLLGVRPKVYQRLMERPTCESLESKIKHYENKKKRKEQSLGGNAEKLMKLQN